MKRSLIVLALAGVASVALAQTPTPRAAHAWGRHERAMRMQHLEAWQLHRLTVLLDLNATQRDQVKTILDQQHAAMRASVKQLMRAMRQARQAHRAAQKETMAKMEHVLSAKQMAKFKVLVPPHRRMQWHHKGPGPMWRHGMGMGAPGPRGH